MKTIVIWHGYLLGATGSNIYTLNLIQAWKKAGHRVVLVCQETNPENYPAIDEYIKLKLNSDGEQETENKYQAESQSEQGAGKCIYIQPDICSLLPVYVVDRYEGFDVKRLIDLNEEEFSRFNQAQASAAEFICKNYSPDCVLINHLVPLPNALAPVFDKHNVPFTIKVHGSELEYAISEDSSQVKFAASGIKSAKSVLVGSTHIERRTIELIGEGLIEDKTSIIPPGVDLEKFVPLKDYSLESKENLLQELSRKLLHAQAVKVAVSERGVEPDAVDKIKNIDLTNTRIITFVGKLIPQKGVHLILKAMPKVISKNPNVLLVIAGFGEQRSELDELLDSMPEVKSRVIWLGLVDHEVLSRLWPLCEVSLVPSILAEAFGMVAAEAAACCCVPLVSNHSGLSDAADVIEREGVELIRLEILQGKAVKRDENVEEEMAQVVADGINARLSLPRKEFERQARQARVNVEKEWGWDALAERVLNQSI